MHIFLLIGRELVRGFLESCSASYLICWLSFLCNGFVFLYIVSLLDGVANTGVVELGDVQLAVYLAEKKSNGQPFFHRGEWCMLLNCSLFFRI